MAAATTEGEREFKNGKKSENLRGGGREQAADCFSNRLATFFHSLFQLSSHLITTSTTNDDEHAATTAVKRNPNFGKLQAGYLFPEVRTEKEFFEFQVLVLRGGG